VRGRCWVRWSVGGGFAWGYRGRGEEVMWDEAGDGHDGCGLSREGKNEIDLLFCV